MSVTGRTGRQVGSREKGKKGATRRIWNGIPPIMAGLGRGALIARHVCPRCRVGSAGAGAFGCWLPGPGWEEACWCWALGGCAFAFKVVL